MNTRAILILMAAILAFGEPERALGKTKMQSFQAEVAQTSAIVVATIASLDKVAEGYFRADFESVEVVASQVQDRDSLDHITVRGVAYEEIPISEPDEETGEIEVEAVAVRIPHVALRQGKRYLFFLDAGQVQSGRPLRYELFVIHDGKIDCYPRGHVYDVGNRGLFCGSELDYAGSPLTMKEIKRRLRIQWNRAKRLFTDLAGDEIERFPEIDLEALP